MGYITRKRGVFYKDGRPVSEAEQVRCRKLGIPPAYKDVKVDPRPGAKLQATAVDATGKKHYYYHDSFLRKQREKRRDRANDIDFGKIRNVTARMLSQLKVNSLRWDDALALRMIASAYLRSGVAERDTGALGAFQLRRRHVKLKGDGETVVFDFPAKSGQRRQFTVKDRVLHRALTQQNAPLLVGNAKWERVRDLLRAIMKNDHLQLKDIRTAGSMQLFTKFLKSVGDEKEAIRQTAQTIGHTPSVSKKFYIL